MAKRVFSIVPHRTNDLQLNELATKIVTVGGLEITTNLSPTTTMNYPTPLFSKFVTLDSIQEVAKKLNFNNPSTSELSKIIKNYDKSNPLYYAKYGSFVERIRVAVQEIILNYPASIYVKDELFGSTGVNVYNVINNNSDNTSSFYVNTNYFSNPFNIYYLKNGEVLSSEQIPVNRNLTLNYFNFELLVSGESYPIMEFVGSERETNTSLKFKVKGQPFKTGNISKEFYIKLSEDTINKVYNDLDDLESYLIDRENDFISLFQAVKESNGGLDLEYVLKFQFPKLDDLNIDVTSSKYNRYLTDLINYAKIVDENDANIIMRMLVDDSIQSITFAETDTEFPTFGKINTIFILWGRMYDEIYKEIENIKFFTTVTYNKKNNAPDNIIKNIASTLGWDVYMTDHFGVEFWRKIILNTWYIWKSKGTRKAIEFILDFLNISSEIVDFNQYIYVATEPIDVEEFKYYLNLIDENLSVEDFPIDEEGYPTYNRNSIQDYFQQNGLEDNGLGYLNKYINLLPEFSGSSVTYTAETITQSVLFEQDYDFSGNTLNYNLIKDNFELDSCYISEDETILDPLPEKILDICGCPLPISDKTLEITIDQINLYDDCLKFVVDVHYECLDTTQAKMNVDVYGGTKPYTYVGLNDGDILNTGTTYSVYIIDVNGCISNNVSGSVVCYDPCLDVVIEADIQYECIIDEFGQKTGQAILDISASGGVPPYNYIGAQSGDTVNHAELVTVIIEDSNGCKSPQFGTTIDCEAQILPACQSITLDATLETTDSEIPNKTAQLTLTYDIIGLPVGVIVTGVTILSSGVTVGDDNYIIGSPIISTFNSKNGADKISLDFVPDEITSTITIQHTIMINTQNGCQYTDSYQLTVNPRQLGNNANYNQILSP